jgi:hypothetical protein
VIDVRATVFAIELESLDKMRKLHREFGKRIAELEQPVIDAASRSSAFAEVRCCSNSRPVLHRYDSLKEEVRFEAHCRDKDLGYTACFDDGRAFQVSLSDLVSLMP